MNRLYRLSSIVAVLALSLSLAGCGDDDDGNKNGNNNPPAPSLGADQIDRMGRPGVNTALTDPFFRESMMAEQDRHDSMTDEYNGAASPAQWAGMFAESIAGSLAIIDSLDRDCGNQLLAGPTATAGRYDALAGVLADDQLYVNTDSGSCQQYLAVEGNAVGITNSDCGGRTPLEDTIDTTYSVLAAGVLSGVGDGVPVDADGTPSLTNFPFLAPPNN